MQLYDFAVIGAGIVGLSTGLALKNRFADARIVVLEKETQLAFHQTGHNSGVIHSGIYYKPGSAKARFAREGHRSIVEFCRKHEVKHQVCGKVIVATESWELPLLDDLYRRGLANGLNVSKIDRAALKEIEPHVWGLAAIHVPNTGIVDFKQVAQTFARLLEERGGDLKLGARVWAISKNDNGLVIESSKGVVQARFLINCAGLHSDRVAKLMNVETGMRIIPFRGEYYKLRLEKRHLVKHLIYPVPNPDFPFLGVHFTPTVNGEVHAGPNAVLSLKREGYSKTDFNLRDFVEVISYPAFWKLALRNYKEGAKEMMRSFSKRIFTQSLQRLIPELQEDDLVPSEAGVRAQALMKDGSLMDDFLIIQGHKSIHVCNAPSPAATAAIPIGQTIVKQIDIN